MTAGLLLPTLVGLLILTVPGASLLAVRRAGLVTLASAAPIAVALLGTTGVAFGASGVPFSPATVTPVLIAVAVLGIVLRVRGRRSESAPLPGSLIPPVLAALVGAAATTGILLAGIGSADAISLSYDAVFHLSASASVLDSGHASSFTLYEVSNPGTAASDYYPAAWHALVALVAASTGVAIPVATNAATVAVAVAAWLPGVVFLADSMFPEVRHRTVLRASAAVFASCFAAFPLLLVDWGTLYPTYLAYALLPTGLGLLVLLLRGGRRTVTAGLLAVWFLAEVFAHPRSLPTFAVLATPLLVSSLVTWLVRLHRMPQTRRRARALAAAISGAALVTVPLTLVALFRMHDTPGRPISDRLNGGPARANQSVEAALGQALGLGPVVSPSESAVPPSLLLAAAVLGGVILCVRHPRSLWIAVSWAALVVLYTLAASSDSDVAKVLTGLWYKDKYRLMAAIPVLAVPLSAFAVASAARLIRRSGAGRDHRRAPAAAVTALISVVALSAWSGPSIHGTVAATRIIFTPPEGGDKGGALLDRDARDLLERVDDFVPVGERVLGNPWNGAALTWALGDREPVFPHLTGDWDEPRVVLAQRLDAALLDPAVCAAAAELDATHVFASDGLLGGGGEPALFYAGIDRAVAVPGLLTEVAREGDAVLYALTACD